MANVFGGPSSGQAFGVGLASGIMGGLKDEYERSHAEEEKNKQIDYEILMKALEQMKPDLTPSQAAEIMTRAVDIFKPKGHGGIKQNIKDIFGGRPQYEPQSGQIINDVRSKPRLQVGTEANLPSLPSILPPGVQLPNAPTQQRIEGGLDTPIYEKTYREQEIEDYGARQQAMEERQLAVEQAKSLAREQARQAQNAEIRARYREQMGIKSDAAFDLVVRKKMAELGLYEDTPENRTLAAEAARQDREDKKLLVQNRIEYNRARIKKMDADISNAQERIKIARARMSNVSQTAFDKDPQIKGAWAKVQQYKQQAASLRTEAAILHGKSVEAGYDAAMQRQAEDLEVEAEKAETEIQNLIVFIEGRRKNLAGEVTLPNAPKGAPRKGAVKLTAAEILAAGGSQKDVDEAKRRGVLAQ